jgi:Recombination endonuclease VII
VCSLPERTTCYKEYLHRVSMADTQRRNWLARYHVTPEWYDEQLERQGGACAICGSTNAEGRGRGGGRFAVDHDHACCPERGKSCGMCVRGLLCSTCNKALGGFRDDPVRLASAIAYLAREQ